MLSLLARFVVFTLLVGGFLGACWAIPRVLDRFSRVLPDNYENVAREALASGDAKRALAITEKRHVEFYYDFVALYLQSDALLALARSNDAVELLKRTLRMSIAARANNKESLGFDEAENLRRLASALMVSGRESEAREVARAARDAGARVANDLLTTSTLSPADTALAKMLSTHYRPLMESVIREVSAQESAWRRDATAATATTATRLLAEAATTSSSIEAYRSTLADSTETLAAVASAPTLLAFLSQFDGPTTLAVTLRDKLTSTRGVRPVAGGQWSLGRGIGTTTGGLRFLRNGEARVNLESGVFQANTIAFVASGTQALGQWPLLAIKQGDTELTRVYLDSAKPVPYAVKLFGENAPRQFELRIEFLNDAFDPVSKDDRNANLAHIVFY